MNNALLYVRVSHDEQAKFGYSLDAQEQALKDYCIANNLHIKGIYRDEGISGGSIAKRKSFQRMINDAKNGDVVLFTKLDRFSRNLLDANVVVLELEKKGVSIKAIHEDDIDTTTADGKFVFNLKLSLAQREREKTSERIKDVFAYKKSVGEVVSGSVPIGYKIENKHLVINEETKEQAIFIFEQYDITGSKRETLRRFNLKYGTNKCVKTIDRVLKDTTYIGERYGNKEFAEPIISKELFYRVNDKVLNSQHGRRTAKVAYLFTGLIKCPRCGKRMGAHNHQNRRIYYRCPNNKNHLRCDFGLTFPEDSIEEQVIKMLEVFKNEQTVQFTDAGINVEEIKKEMDQAKKKIERTKELYIDGDITKEMYTAKISEFEGIIAKYDEILANSENKPQTKEMALNMLQIYNSLTRENKKAFYLRFVKEIKVNEKKEVVGIVFG